MLEYTFLEPSTGEYKEKGSIYHSIAEPTSSIDNIKSRLILLKDEFPDASHICYAYRIKQGNNLDEFSSDAGEPIGSAGKPILNTLKRQNLINAVIFVIRYFGGTKLGIPGLIQAYGAAAEGALENSKLKTWLKQKRLSVTYPYKLEGGMKSILQKNQVEVILENYGEKIDIQLLIDIESANRFINSIKELSAGSAQIIIED